MVVLEAAPATDTSGGGTGVRVRVRCDDMSCAADFVQALASSCGLVELNPRAAFPLEMERLDTVIASINEANASRTRLATALADGSNRIKALVIRAEDARLRHDAALVRRAYAQLVTVNRELIAEHRRRALVHEDLLGALRAVNACIQAASRMRLGPQRTALVNACRAALRDNNPAGVFAAIAGKSAVAQ